MYEKLELSPLFRGLTAAEIEDLLSDKSYTVKEFSAGDIIAEKDTAYSSLMLILDGVVRGETTDFCGGVMKVNQIKAPNLISPAFLYGGYNRLPIDVVAHTDTSILEIHRGSVFAMMQENVLVLSNFIDIISQRANLLTKKLFFLSFKSLESKVAEYLLNKTYNTDECIDKQKLVHYFEVPVDSMDRVLNSLAKTGAIKVAGQKVIIADGAQLSEIIKS